MVSLRIKTPEVVTDLTAWLAFLAGILGSFAATGTFIGDTIGGLSSHIPIYFAVPAALLGLYSVLRDLTDDGIPNRLRTIYITILWPSVLLGVQGKGAKDINGWIKDMNTSLDDKVGPWVSDNPTHTTTHTMMTILAIMFISFSLYEAHRYFSAKRANRATAAPVATSSATPTISATRKKR